MNSSISIMKLNKWGELINKTKQVSNALARALLNDCENTIREQDTEIQRLNSIVENTKEVLDTFIIKAGFIWTSEENCSGVYLGNHSDMEDIKKCLIEIKTKAD